MKTKKEIEKYWVNQCKSVLLGRTIKSVRYLTNEEMKDMDWYKRPILIELDNGTLCIPSRDDEGNDGGSLFYQEKGKKIDVLPVIM